MAVKSPKIAPLAYRSLLMFSAQPEMIHNINFLPITPSSLCLGRRPDYVQANFDEVVVENGGQPDDWVDIMWEYLAPADPQTALGHFNGDPNCAPEGGESKAHTYYWLHGLLSLGRLDPGVTADTPHYAVFTTDAGVNYVFYNPEDTARTISFSDGRPVAAGVCFYHLEAGGDVLTKRMTLLR